jgi:hypothetical protein
VPEAQPIDTWVTQIDITPRPAEEPAGSGRRRPQLRLALTILAVLAAFGLGLVTARGPAPTPEQPPTNATPPNLAAPIAYIVSTGGQCSVQNGQTLQVGIELTNRGVATAAILFLLASAPLGGLTLREVGWGACGHLQPIPIDSTDTNGLRLIPPGGSDWIYARFDVLVACPAPYPVRFLIGPPGSTDLVDVGGFNDLGNVPYTGCT